MAKHTQSPAATPRTATGPERCPQTYRLSMLVSLPHPGGQARRQPRRLPARPGRLRPPAGSDPRQAPTPGSPGGRSPPVYRPPRQPKALPGPGGSIVSPRGAARPPLTSSAICCVSSVAGRVAEVPPHNMVAAAPFRSVALRSPPRRFGPPAQAGPSLPAGRDRGRAGAVLSPGPGRRAEAPSWRLGLSELRGGGRERPAPVAAAAAGAGGGHRPGDAAGPLRAWQKGSRPVVCSEKVEEKKAKSKVATKRCLGNELQVCVWPVLGGWHLCGSPSL